MSTKKNKKLRRNDLSHYAHSSRTNVSERRAKDEGKVLMPSRSRGIVDTRKRRLRVARIRKTAGVGRTVSWTFFSIHLVIATAPHSSGNILKFYYFWMHGRVSRRVRVDGKPKRTSNHIIFELIIEVQKNKYLMSTN